MNRRARLLIIAGLCGTFPLMPGTARAIEPDAAVFVVRQAAKEGLDTFAGKRLTRNEQRQSADRLMLRYADRRQWAMQVLGRYWAKASPDEQYRFQSQIVDYIVVFWGGELNNLSKDQRITIVGAERHGDRVLVHSRSTLAGDKPSPVDWLVGPSADGHPVILDLVANGVSPVTTMRDDFAAVLRTNGGRVDLLMQAMQKKIDAAVASK